MFWAGIFDLVALKNPLCTEFVINGDPVQGLAKFPVRGTQSKNDQSGIGCVAEVATLYVTITHRYCTILTNTFGVHTTNPTAGHLTYTVGPKKGIPVCTASPRYVQVLSAAGREAYTYESVQGEDFDKDMKIDMTGLENAFSDRTAVVALTRSKTGVYLQMEAANPKSVINIHETHGMAEEDRETAVGGCQTDQFKETAFVNPDVHKRHDILTYFLSVERRLKYATYEQNLARKKKCPRQDMIDEYQKLVPEAPQWAPESFEGYIDRAVNGYVSKRTEKDVLKKPASHDPDRTGADIKISLKNQVIKKSEKRHTREATPGQSCFWDCVASLGGTAHMWYSWYIARFLL